MSSFEPVVEPRGRQASSLARDRRRLSCSSCIHSCARWRMRLVAVALAHLAPSSGFRMIGRWRVRRPRVAERFLEGDVVERVEQVLLPAEDVGDAHLGVVDDDGEVVRRHAVALADDEVLHLRRRRRPAWPSTTSSKRYSFTGIANRTTCGRPSASNCADLLVGELRAAVDERALRLLGLRLRRVELVRVSYALYAWPRAIRSSMIAL